MKISELLLQENQIKENILSFINSPNFDTNLGKNWYQNAQSDLREILAELGLTERLFIGEIALICSILSPSNRWETNLKDTKSVLENHFCKGTNGTFYTYGPNVAKANKFLSERAEYRVKNSHKTVFGVFNDFSRNWAETNMKAPKTYNFYHNLTNPFYYGNFFTIDRHMLKVAGLEVLSLKGKQYDILKTWFIQVMKSDKRFFDTDKLSSESFRPCQFQSVLWANYVFIKRGILHY